VKNPDAAETIMLPASRRLLSEAASGP